jgi:hypothetical protein
MITPYSDWPGWLQFVVMAPNVVLVAITCWVWWPRSDREWNKFGLVMAYLVVFYLVMKFVFRFR